MGARFEHDCHLWKEVGCFLFSRLERRDGSTEHDKLQSSFASRFCRTGAIVFLPWQRRLETHSESYRFMRPWRVGIRPLSIDGVVRDYLTDRGANRRKPGMPFIT